MLGAPQIQGNLAVSIPAHKAIRLNNPDEGFECDECLGGFAATRI